MIVDVWHSEGGHPQTVQQKHRNLISLQGSWNETKRMGPLQYLRMMTEKSLVLGCSTRELLFATVHLHMVSAEVPSR